MSVQLTHKLRNPKNLSQWLDIWTADVTEKKDEQGNIITNEYIYTINPSQNWKIPATNLIGSDLSDDGSSSTSFLNQEGNWVDVGYNLSIDSNTESSYNLKLTQTNNNDKEDIINIKLNNPIYSTFTEKENGNPPSLSLLVTNIMDENIGDEAGISTSKLDPDARTAINNNKEIIKNEETQEEIVTYDENNISKVWATDNKGKPAWRKTTDQFDTQLLGVWISDHSHLNEEINIFDNLNSDWDKNHCGIWVEI